MKIRDRTHGQPLEDAILEKARAWLGYDFSGVRVHRGPGADALTGALGARAFTLGADVFFARGAYAPASDAGRALIAHELVHVVQQSGPGRGPTQNGVSVAPAEHPLEQEAEALAAGAAADWAQARVPRRHVVPGSARPGTIQRALRDTCMSAPPRIISCHATTTWWLYQEAHGASADWNAFLGGAHKVSDYLSDLIQQYGRKRTQWFTTGTISVQQGSVLVFTDGMLPANLPTGHSCVCGNDGRLHGSSQGGCFSDCTHGKVGMCDHAPGKINWSKWSMSKVNGVYDVYSVSESDAEKWARANL